MIRLVYVVGLQYNYMTVFIFPFPNLSFVMYHTFQLLCCFNIDSSRIVLVAHFETVIVSVCFSNGYELSCTREDLK